MICFFEVGEILAKLFGNQLLSEIYQSSECSHGFKMAILVKLGEVRLCNTTILKVVVVVVVFHPESFFYIGKNTPKC